MQFSIKLWSHFGMWLCLLKKKKSHMTTQKRLRLLGGFTQPFPYIWLVEEAPHYKSFMLALIHLQSLTWCQTVLQSFCNSALTCTILFTSWETSINAWARRRKERERERMDEKGTVDKRIPEMQRQRELTQKRQKKKRSLLLPLKWQSCWCTTLAAES